MSTCELPLPGSPAPFAEIPAPSTGSRLHRFQGADSGPGPFCWEGVPRIDYKPAADHHCGVLRSVLVGERGEQTAFHLRYFEISPGGHSTLEQHQHEHVVVVLRGRGEVRLGSEFHVVGFGDTIYIAPREIHQLRTVGEEPFGFLCVVDAVRDRPVVVE